MGSGDWGFNEISEWTGFLDCNATRSDIRTLNDNLKKGTELTNNNMASLSQRLDRIDANQALLAKALMQLS
jgi:hypothetical protein